MLSGVPMLCLPQSPFSLMSRRGYSEDSFAIVALPKTLEGGIGYFFHVLLHCCSLAHKTRNQSKAGLQTGHHAAVLCDLAVCRPCASWQPFLLGCQ